MTIGFSRDRFATSIKRYLANNYDNHYHVSTATNVCESSGELIPIMNARASSNNRNFLSTN